MAIKKIAYLLLLIVVSGCVRITEPEFRKIGGFKLKSIGLNEVTIGFGITYYNPNGFSVTVKETGADIFLDGTFLGKFSQDSVIDVHKKADFTIPLSGTITMETFLNLNLKDAHKREFLVKAEGNTKVGKAGIFISKAVKYEGKHRLNQIRL